MNRRITRRIADAVSEAFQIRVFELSPVKTPPVFPVPADPLELLSPLPGIVDTDGAPGVFEGVNNTVDAGVTVGVVDGVDVAEGVGVAVVDGAGVSVGVVDGVGVSVGVVDGVGVSVGSVGGVGVSVGSVGGVYEFVIT